VYLKNPLGVVKVYSNNTGGIFLLSNDVRNNMPTFMNSRVLLGMHFFECPHWETFKEWSSHVLKETIHPRVKGAYWVTDALCRDIRNHNSELAGKLEAVLREC
jgi:hypothetical protein